jgi:YD repeat-containing protein
LSITYNSWGDVTSITDTLSRVINFNYDGYDNLISITQSWNGQTHQWAPFGYDSNYYVGYNFPGLTSYGPDGSHITVLTQVGLADGSRYNFEYNNTYGQVSTIRYYARDNHQRRYTTYVYSAMEAIVRAFLSGMTGPRTGTATTMTCRPQTKKR